MVSFPEKLLDGYQNFMSGRYLDARERYRTLAEQGQKPQTLVIACCDSHAAPEMVFDAGPGELFVVRNVANMVPPYEPDGQFHSTSAALEFAVQALRVKEIIVMGHGRCGGIRAALDPSAEPLSPGDFIGKWMGLLAPAADKLGIDLIWFGVLLCVNMQTSFMHPPFGFALFYLRGIAPPVVKSRDIYWG
eukprot:gene58133-79615_t